MPQRVLLIDDSPQMHRLVEAWLRVERLDVTCCGSAADGFAAATANPPDLILLDVDMPVENGFELCRRIKGTTELADVPVVFLTGSTQPQDRVAGLNLGAVDYVNKPFHPAEFQARVRAALRTKYLIDLLREKAQIDGLTGLRNRAYFDARFRSEMALVRRHPRPTSCVMIDVDFFKNVNDTYGHACGDDALRRVADVIQRGVRIEDVPCRFGGEEFVILTPGVDAASAAVLAERLRVQISAESIRRQGGFGGGAGDNSFNVTCSFGVADVCDDSAEATLKRADDALYAAKRGGRNTVRVASPPPAAVAA